MGKARASKVRAKQAEFVLRCFADRALHYTRNGVPGWYAESYSPTVIDDDGFEFITAFIKRFPGRLRGDTWRTLYNGRRRLSRIMVGLSHACILRRHRVGHQKAYLGDVGGWKYHYWIDHQILQNIKNDPAEAERVAQVWAEREW